MTKINLLWTGGLDSTFRLVELAHEDIEIQPYYIVDTTRGSIPQETQAMNKILSLLRKKPFTKATIQDVKLIPDTTILTDNDITEKWKFFVNTNKLGSQYDYLARFAKQNNLILEVGLECSERSKATNVLKEYGALQLHSYTSLESQKDINSWDCFYAITPESAHPYAKAIFENLRFPSHLFSLEKIEEAELLKEWGCRDILNSTWFCHRPIFGYPCGRCNPCKDALNEGMSWRVPVIGRILGTIRGVWNKSFGRVNRLLFKPAKG